MRGDRIEGDAIFSYVMPEQRIPQDHPLRPIRKMADTALEALDKQFDRIYAKTGRPSIAPERLLRALLLQVLYSIRSERMLIEQLNYNLLFRWFVGLNMDDAVWVPTVFTKNRDRLLGGEIAQGFFEAVLAQARKSGLLSDEHFSVDGTLIEAWASLKSFKPKDGSNRPDDGDPGNPSVDFHGEKLSNKTHESTTDKDVRLYKKSAGAPARLGYMGHVLMENRHGLAVDTRLTHATGKAECEAALDMARNIPGEVRATLGADKGYDTEDFVDSLRSFNITPHVAQNQYGNRASNVDDRTTRHEGYGLSLKKRKRIEEIYGWMKTVGVFRKTRHRGIRLVNWMFTFTAAAYNMVRMRTLLAGA